LPPRRAAARRRRGRRRRSCCRTKTERLRQWSCPRTTLWHEVVCPNLGDLVAVGKDSILVSLNADAHFHRLVSQHLEVLEGPDLERVADIRQQTLTNLDRLLALIGERYILEDFPSFVCALGDLEYRKHVGAARIFRHLFATSLNDVRRLPTRRNRHKIRGARVLRRVEDFGQLKLVIHC